MYLAILLILLAKILPHTKPYVNAGIYAAAKFFMLLLLGTEFISLVISTILGFAAAFIYFIIMLRLDRSIVGWFLFGVFGAILVTLI